jgi:hypothetical protein
MLPSISEALVSDTADAGNLADIITGTTEQLGESAFSFPLSILQGKFSRKRRPRETLLICPQGSRAGVNLVLNSK